MNFEGFSGNSDGLLHFLASRCAVFVMDELFKRRAQTADIVFVMEENGVEKRIPAHKCVLAMGSPVFEEMFFGPKKQFIDGAILARTTTISSQTFDAFITLFYGKYPTSFKANE